MTSRRGAARRAVLLPATATNEGSRRIRELLRKHTFGWIARKLTCDEKTVRAWAREDAKPSLIMRARAHERLAIDECAWDERPRSDAYSTSDPATSRLR